MEYEYAIYFKSYEMSEETEVDIVAWGVDAERGLAQAVVLMPNGRLRLAPYSELRIEKEPIVRDFYSQMEIQKAKMNEDTERVIANFFHEKEGEPK